MIMEKSGTLVSVFFYVLPKWLEKYDETWYNTNRSEVHL